MKQQIKLCGFSREEDMDVVNEVCPDLIGFVFAKSKRQIDSVQALRLKQKLKKEIQAVGVFVNEEVANIVSLLQKGIIDIAQLHGEESAEEIREIKEKTGKKVIKAYAMKSDEKEKIELFSQMEAAIKAGADALLLDAYSKERRGGTGRTFSWEQLCGVSYPYFLAGGLNEERLVQAVDFFKTHPEIPSPIGFDLSSGIETDGKKDEKKIRRIMKIWSML